jgi:hypothetical protein
MFQGSLVPGADFILDIQDSQLTIRDIVRLCYVTNDGRHVMVQPAETNVLIRVTESDFRKNAKQRIPLAIAYAPPPPPLEMGQ